MPRRRKTKPKKKPIGRQVSKVVMEVRAKKGGLIKTIRLDFGGKVEVEPIRDEFSKGIIIKQGDNVHIIRTGNMPKSVSGLSIEMDKLKQKVAIVPKGEHTISENGKNFDYVSKGEKRFLEIGKTYKLGLGGIPRSAQGMYPEIEIRLKRLSGTRVVNIPKLKIHPDTLKKISKHKKKIKSALKQ